MARLLTVLSIFVIVATAYTSSCEKPEVTSKTFTTQDATIVANIAFVSEFSVQCASGSLTNLYADIEGVVVPVSRIGTDRFQVSWTEDTKTARRGDRVIRIFDEDGSAAIRKAVRDGDDISSVEPLFNVVINHPGAFSGPWLKSEFMAAVLSLAVAYVALSSRAKVVS